jgi:hypothetical protein
MTQSAILTPVLATPTAAAFATATTGGSLVAATYYYRVSAINAQGETLAFAEQSEVVPAGTSTNTVTVNWVAVTGATGYKVYGRTTGAELLIATTGAVTAYIDTGAITPAGALPAANTTGLGPGTSTDVTIADGAGVTIGIYTTSGSGIAANDHAKVYIDTPGDDAYLCTLSADKPAERFLGPATYRVKRGYTNGPLGVYKEV